MDDTEKLTSQVETIETIETDEDTFFSEKIETFGMLVWRRFRKLNPAYRIIPRSARG